MSMSKVLKETTARDTLVSHNRYLDFVFPVFGFLHGANLLDDDMRVPFHCSAPPFCSSSHGHLVTLLIGVELI